MISLVCFLCPFRLPFPLLFGLPVSLAINFVCSDLFSFKDFLFGENIRKLGFEVTFNPPYKIGLTGLHDSVFKAFFYSLAPTRMSLSDRPLLYEDFCRFLSVMVVILLNASFS